ncbi:MAG: M15 family metallopeptidase [Negativicutes bacterium]|jgi:D-alanyl-D-alanine dipeptidase
MPDKFDLVRLDEFDNRLTFDIRYATADNFLNKVLYPCAIAVARRGTADKLKIAADYIERLGFRFKIWDAYRPVAVHNLFWEVLPDSDYIANPATGGSKHSRGCAIDLTLIDTDGNELEMPTVFDDVTYNAGRKHAETLPLHIRENLAVLTDAMESAGFESIDSEWWHYCDSEWREYPALDVELDEFN